MHASLHVCLGRVTGQAMGLPLEDVGQGGA